MNTKRKNPFASGKDEWIVLSPERLKRPWNGKLEIVEETDLPDFDPHCYLCPGTDRHNGEKNPVYTTTYVFPNDTSTFHPPTIDDPQTLPATAFFTEAPEYGECEVVVYTPHHNKLMMHMELHEIEEIIHTWTNRYIELGKKDYINHVAIFETRGKELGNSMLHPHGQIWAESIIPPVVMTEIEKQKNLSLVDYLHEEMDKDLRIVYQNQHFVIVVPFWANFPYETMIIPTFPVSSLDQLHDAQIADLAKTLKIQIQAYATLFERPKFGSSYMFSIHQKPTDKENYDFFQMHFHFRTPMLTPTRQKYFAGYEENFGYQRDLTPEMAAAKLKEIIQKQH